MLHTPHKQSVKSRRLTYSNQETHTCTREQNKKNYIKGLNISICPFLLQQPLARCWVYLFQIHHFFLHLNVVHFIEFVTKTRKVQTNTHDSTNGNRHALISVPLSLVMSVRHFVFFFLLRTSQNGHPSLFGAYWLQKSDSKNSLWTFSLLLYFVKLLFLRSVCFVWLDLDWENNMNSRWMCALCACIHCQRMCSTSM